MIVRFQADADLNFLIVRKLLRREPEIDFQSATKAGLAGQSDPEVLALAAREGRILVSHDETTMPRQFANFFRKEHSADIDRQSGIAAQRRGRGTPADMGGQRSGRVG